MQNQENLVLLGLQHFPSVTWSLGSHRLLASVRSRAHGVVTDLMMMFFIPFFWNTLFQGLGH